MGSLMLHSQNLPRPISWFGLFLQQNDSSHSYTFWTMPIMIFSPVSNFGDQSLGKFLLIVYQPVSVKPPNSHSGWTDIDYLASICLALLIANSVESELVYYKCVWWDILNVCHTSINQNVSSQNVDSEMISMGFIWIHHLFMWVLL